MANEQVQISQDNWKYRRRLTYNCVYTMLAMSGYLAIWGSDGNVVQSTLAQALPFGVVGILLAYVTGAVADDAFKMHLAKS